MTLYEKIRRFNLYYIFFITFVVAFGKVFQNEVLSFGKHPEKCLHIPIILTLFLAFKERGYRWPITYREKIFLAYVFFSTSSILWGLNFETSMHALREFWAVVLFVVLIAYNVRTERELKLLVNIFLAGVLVRGGISIAGYFVGHDPVAGSFPHYNVYANFLLLPVSLLFGKIFYDSESVFKKCLLFCLLLLIMYTLFITMSRANVVALLLAVMLFSLLANRKVLVASISIVFVSIAMIYAFPDNAVSKRVRSAKWEDGSLQSRVRGIWPAAVNMYKDHNPIWGSGPGSFTILLKEPKYRELTRGHSHPHAHNVLLHALVTQGGVGALMYLFFIVQVIWLSWKNLKFSSDPYYKALGAAGLIWIISHVIAGIVHFEFQHSRLNMSVGFMVALLTLSYYSWKYSETQKGDLADK